jgi:hypothetical protein
MKYLVDDMFLSGANHVFYHGTCYSPDEAAWPGWEFYASYEMNPRNSVWRDVPALNAYVTRCQSVLQAGKPDNDILLYWPIHDYWSNPEGMAKEMTVHADKWFEQQPIGRTAEALWKSGYQFDYASDKQLGKAGASGRGVILKGGNYGTIVVPPCDHMPVETLAKLISLARSGKCSVVFVDKLPHDVPGLGKLDERLHRFNDLLKHLKFSETTNGVRCAAFGRKHGQLLVGPLQAALDKTGVQREPLFDQSGLMCIRRALPDGRYYFIANRGDKFVDGWVPVATQTGSVSRMDPMNGQVGFVPARLIDGTTTQVQLSLPPGGSVVLRTFNSRQPPEPPPPRWVARGESVELTGQWHVSFLSGGPVLPAAFVTERLASWTQANDTNASSFAGTALYALRFDVPGDEQDAELQYYQLDLGKVCQSARVRLNGKDVGTVFTPPFRVVIGKLKPKDNLLEVEVTNTSANRIRDLDRRGVKWQNFHDINYVNVNYQRFNASDWPSADSGLLGPVTLTPLRSTVPGSVQ